jgi:hypothetical protein
MIKAARYIKRGTSIVISMRLVLMIRQQSHLGWVQEKRRGLLAIVKLGSLHLDFYVTKVVLPVEGGHGQINARTLEESKELGF